MGHRQVHGPASGAPDAEGGPHPAVPQTPRRSREANQAMHSFRRGPGEPPDNALGTRDSVRGLRHQAHSR
eukprot:8560828-Heterocapsa_arctica.AAC.1